MKVAVEETLTSLLKQEDTNGDHKITVEDQGPKCFTLSDGNNQSYSFVGEFHLSLLLQLLAYHYKKGDKYLDIDIDKLLVNPVDLLLHQIKNIHWRALTRKQDQKGVVRLLEDTKGVGSSNSRIYYPKEDTYAKIYFETLKEKNPSYSIEIIALEDPTNSKYVKQIESRPGLLSLGFNKENSTPFPYVVPGGRFNELYAWDSYFIIEGLIIDKKYDLALSMIENFNYQIDHYKMILNANRTYYLLRTQPPLFSSIILACLEKIPNKKTDRVWLKRCLSYLIDEYNLVWSTNPRKTDNGLNCYSTAAEGVPIEVERGHFKEVFKHFSKKSSHSAFDYEKRYKANQIKNEKLDLYFKHDRAMRESGHDTTARLVNCCSHLNTVDLNCLLYKMEKDIGYLIETCFQNKFEDHHNEKYKSHIWYKRAEIRKEIMNELLYDEEKKLFFDYNFKLKEKHHYYSATIFYPLFTGVASKEQARHLVNHLLPQFEQKGGIISSLQDSVDKFSGDGKLRQWDYPFGWAPHQMLIWQGLINYGFVHNAQRLAYKWLYMITTEAMKYNCAIVEKYDVVKASLKANVEYGNIGEEFTYYPNGGFGWTNASYKFGIELLTDSQLKELKNLTDPSQLF